MASAREREEPGDAALVFTVLLPELLHEPTLLEKRPEVEVGDDGRRRGGAVSGLHGVEREQQRAPKVKRVAYQAVPLPGEEALVAARRLPLSFPMPLPLAQADELLEIPRRPQEQGRPEDLHPVEEEAD